MEKTHEIAEPDPYGLLSEKDAFAIPGLGPMGEHRPAVQVMATDDTLTLLVIDEDAPDDTSMHRRIELVAGPQITMQVGDDVEIRVDHESVVIDTNGGQTQVAVLPNEFRVSVRGGGSITFSLAGDGSLSVTASGAVDISASGPVDISGSPVTINGTRVASQPARTGTSSQHSHSLTAA